MSEVFYCKSIGKGAALTRGKDQNDAAVKFVSEHALDLLSYEDDFEGGLQDVVTVFVSDPKTGDCIAEINVSATIKVSGIEFSNWNDRSEDK